MPGLGTRRRAWRNSALSQAVGIVAGSDKKLAGALGANAGKLDERGRELGDKGRDQLVEAGDLVVEIQDRRASDFSAILVAVGPVAERRRVWTRRGEGPDEFMRVRCRTSSRTFSGAATIVL